LLSCIEWTGLFETNNTNTALDIFNKIKLDTSIKCIVSNHISKNKINSAGLPINEIIEVKYPTLTPKDYLNIVNSYFVTTGSRLIEHNFPNSTNNTQYIF